MFLMCGDREVSQFSMDTDVSIVLRRDLLPFPLRQNPSIRSWLRRRVLLLERSNVNWLYNNFQFMRPESDESREFIALFCRAVSVLDNYWIKFDEGDTAAWDAVNIRANHLSAVVQQIALTGDTISLCGPLATPELTTQGLSAKAWFRREDGLYLYKGGERHAVEIECSDILDCCNVEHIFYTKDTYMDLDVCKCKCFTSDDVSMISAADIGLSYEDMFELDSENMMKMWIADYLLANGDRHLGNWGFLYRSDNMDILGCCPLFDHDNAFHKLCMENPDYPCLSANGASMREAAKYACENVDFHFTRQVTRDVFLCEEHYECFLRRARELNLCR